VNVNTSLCRGEQEVQHIPTFGYIFIAFSAHLARFFRASLALVSEEVVIRDRLRADEAALEVGVDHADCVWRGVAHVDSPGAHFLHACRSADMRQYRGA